MADDALSPELEERLRAAMTVIAVPPAPPPGQPLPPPPGPLSAADEARRQAALVAWQAQAQQLLDTCVARPGALREQTSLDVMFAPPLEGAGHAAQRLLPVAISVPADELARLWRDMDPDALQGCLDQIRTLALALPPARDAKAAPLPPSADRIRVTL